MNALEIGQKLVELCKQGKHGVVFETLYAPDIVSVEAATMPSGSAESRGLPAVLEKSKWWTDNHIVHEEVLDGPYPHGDRFIVKFTYDITNKPSNQRFRMQEMGLYTVENGKIVREEFFYSSP